ncbi:MAG: NAD-dependent epimerase/dehydratase family protein [Acidimicrobiia bacterium]
MRVLVTGGAGFIGSHVTDRLLALGHAVDVVDSLATGSRRNLATAEAAAPHRLWFSETDVRDPGITDLIAERRPEVVYHLAAQADVRVSVARPAFDAEVNVIGSLNVYEGALAAGARKIVLAGSGGTLYGIPESIPTAETLPQHPVSPYGVAKKAAGDYLRYYDDVHDLDWTILALANVYGPRQDPHGEAGVVAIFGRALLAGKVPTIFGDGEQTRDFVYVGDVADAFVRCLDNGNRLLANIGTGRETTVNELFATMAGLCGVGEPATYAPPRTGELRRSALDPSKAADALGWTPATSFESGLERTLAWLGQAPS